MTPSPAAAVVRPDRCPGVLRLHPAADGGLARVRVPGGRLSAEQLRAIARAAELGNGLVDVTGRGNLQLRGLAEPAGEQVECVLDAARLLPSRTHERVRNVVASPVAGRHPASVAPTDALVDELDQRLCADGELSALPERFLFAVDDGSGLGRHARADVTLFAQAPDEGPARFRLEVAGGPVAGGPWPASRAVEAALEAARASLVAPRPASGAGGLDFTDAPALGPGLLAQRDGRTAVTALVPLGRLDRDQVPCLSGLAAEHAGDVRLGAGRRTVTLTDVPAEQAGEVGARLRAIGLVMREDSGWDGLTACAGLGACVKARVDVRAAATRRAAVRGPGRGVEHWSACERRCGLPRTASVLAVTAHEGWLAVTSGGSERRMVGVETVLSSLVSSEAA